MTKPCWVSGIRMGQSARSTEAARRRDYRSKIMGEETRIYPFVEVNPGWRDISRICLHRPRDCRRGNYLVSGCFFLFSLRAHAHRLPSVWAAEAHICRLEAANLPIEAGPTYLDAHWQEGTMLASLFRPTFAILKPRLTLACQKIRSFATFSTGNVLNASLAAIETPELANYVQQSCLIGHVRPQLPVFLNVDRVQ